MASFEQWWSWTRSNGLRLTGVAWSHAPESMAYGLLALAPLGTATGPRAMAMALLGAVVANLVATLAGAGRLVTAPRPAFALLTAGLVTALTAYQGPSGPLSPAVVLALVALGLMAAGVLQMLLGALHFGDMVKYTPHPVRAALLSAVGVLLLIGALPAALGAGFGQALAPALAGAVPGAVLVALSTMGVTAFAARRRTPLPPMVWGLIAGAALHAGLQALGQPAGPRIGVPELAVPWFAHLNGAAWVVELVSQRALWLPLLVFAATVAAFGALDTLLATSVVDGRLRRSRDANRELRAQGIANVLAGFAGGLPNSPSVVRSLELMDAAPHTRRSGVVYTAALLALLVLVPQLLGWLPVSAIGGALLLQGVRIIDPGLWRTPALLRRRASGDQAYDATQRRLLVENWGVALAVVAISVGLGLAAAVATGAALAVLLFVRAHMQQVVRSQHTGALRRSMKVRPPEAAERLQQHGERTVLLELQGALFFGTADTVRASLDALAPSVQTVVLDLFLVDEIDATGARILLEVAEDWARQGRHLVAAEWADRDPRRRIVEAVGRSAGLPPLVFARDVDRALEAAEDRLLASTGSALAPHAAITLEQTLLAQGLNPAELSLLRGELHTRQIEPGALLFRQGDPADGLYLTLQGDVGIRLPGNERRLVSFAPGSMVGEMAALSRVARSADAVAETALTVVWLPNEALDRLRREQPALAAKLLNNIALHLAGRLRGVTQDLSAWVARTGPASTTMARNTEAADADARGAAH
ncbi:SLC26A/SulP transporter family protein [Hydrogenophaga sp. BPS33]|uniref:SLC26A/SulP transporter family protein n=1 Tax=Hydrogenophaga sp. BPS33 TaxID=2651974 RepID=UPI001356D68B|nr:SulP family inorganic anion transporter [Hydrogenophaga sp. BPS33]